MTDSSRRIAGRTETVVLGSIGALAFGEPAPGAVVAGRYEVGRRVGRGGFGVVYEARDRRTGKPVALKILRSDRWSEAAVRRLRREAELVRGLDHPRLARVHRAGSRGGCVYLVMERVRHETLARRLARSEGNPLPVREAAEIAAQVAEGLAALHEAGVVHRDVKPANVLIDRRGRVKLTDFGLARRPRSRDDEEPAEVAGTAEYMAPEDVLGDVVDERSDLYSLGVLLYEMLTGRPPHVGRSSVGTLIAHLREVAPDVREARPEVPAGLAAVTAKLLAREPRERYRSAEELLADLRGHRRRGWLPIASGRERWLPLAVGLVLVFLAVSAFTVHELRPQPRFREVASRPEGLAGIGPRGELLWELSGLNGETALARLRPDEPRRLVGVVTPPGMRDLERTRRLSVLDPETGGSLRTVTLATAPGSFSSFADRYGVQSLVATDLDDDGVDEVLVSYVHQPYWPSYTVLYEPLLERSRVVFIGSGHHRFAGAADLDGDGVRELLFVGLNNRLGYVRAVAAARLVPAVNRPGEAIAASSPDCLRHRSDRPLVWYALLPPAGMHDLQRLASADPRDRLLRFTGPSGGSVRLSYDGFLETARSARTPAKRQTARRRAYAHLREARRLVFGGWPREGLAEMARSVEAAGRSDDPILHEHLTRIQGRLLAHAGRAGEAEAVFERVIATAPRSSSVAFDAGRALHLAGELERAVRWYRRGLGPEGSSTRGRSQWELVEGLIFALDELGRRDEARAELDRFTAAQTSERGTADETLAVYRAYLCWRDGHVPVERFRLHSLASQDVIRYLVLELQWARGEPAPELLVAVEEEIERASDTLPGLLSLRADLLADRGRTAAAEESVRDALDRLERPVDDEVYGRTFRWLIEERASRLGAPGTEG